MKARNLSHRLIAVITFSVGLGVTLLWSAWFQAGQPQDPTSEVVGVLSPARYTRLDPSGGPDLRGTSDNLMAVIHGPQRSVTEPVALPSVSEDLIEYNCGTIVISIDDNRQVSLNGEEEGMLANFSEITDKLKGFFDNRISRRVFSWAMQSRTDLPDEERIYKTVLIKPAPSLSYGEVVKIIEMIKGTGARPVALYTRNLTSW